MTSEDSWNMLANCQSQGKISTISTKKYFKSTRSITVGSKNPLILEEVRIPLKNLINRIEVLLHLSHHNIVFLMWIISRKYEFKFVCLYYSWTNRNPLNAHETTKTTRTEILCTFSQNNFHSWWKTSHRPSRKQKNSIHKVAIPLIFRCAL